MKLTLLVILILAIIATLDACDHENYGGYKDHLRKLSYKPSKTAKTAKIPKTSKGKSHSDDDHMTTTTDDDHMPSGDDDHLRKLSYKSSKTAKTAKTPKTSKSHKSGKGSKSKGKTSKSKGMTSKSGKGKSHSDDDHMTTTTDDDHMPSGDDDHMDDDHMDDDHIDVGDDDGGIGDHIDAGDDDGGIGQNMCATARPQAPRDLTTGAMGSNSIAPMMALHPDWAVEPGMVLVNTHFHNFAEHKTDAANMANPNGAGWACPTPDNMGPEYEWQYCEDVHVGYTYEFHWVHSSGGTGLSPGLGGAFELVNNPSVIVYGQPVVVINRVPNYNPSLSTFSITRPEYGGRTEGTVQLKTYIGSTTGPSYNNEVCSPYEVNWTVDLACTEVTAEAMDMVCKEMIDAGLQVDTHPHEPRMLVDSMWVVPADEVVTVMG